MYDEIIEEALDIFSVGHKADSFEFDDISYPDYVVIKSKLTDEKYICIDDEPEDMVSFASTPSEWYAFIQHVKINNYFTGLMPNIIISFSPKWFYDMNNTCPEEGLVNVLIDILNVIDYNNYDEGSDNAFYPINKTYDETVADLTSKGFIVKEV